MKYAMFPNLNRDGGNVCRIVAMQLDNDMLYAWCIKIMPSLAMSLCKEY